MRSVHLYKREFCSKLGHRFHMTHDSVFQIYKRVVSGQKLDKIGHLTQLGYSRGNKCHFWQIFVGALKEFPNLFIQSETSASIHEYSESNSASKYVMLLSNFGDEHHMLSPILRGRIFAIDRNLFP